MKDKFGSWVAGGNSTKGRKEDDFYPTPAECTIALLNNFCFPGIIWEAACGTGEMAEILINAGHNVIATDLIDRGYGICNTDFLMETEKRANCLITNPPFNLAEKFIRKCKELEIETFALLLKSQYWHAAKRTKLFNEITPSKILAMNWRPDFTGGGGPTMDCIWCLWQTKSDFCEYRPIERPKT